MGRPPKRNDDDLDIYNEAALTEDNVEQGSDAPYDSETDDVLPELGQETAHERLSHMRDDESYDNGPE
jgi:hypothetical protein